MPAVRPETEGPARRFRPADLDACLAIFDGNVPAFFAASERPTFEAYLERPPDHYLVVANDEHVIVACGGYRLVPQERLAKLRWGMVARPHHHRGWGRRLLRIRLRAIGAAPDIERITVATSPSAAGFYLREGFVEVRRQVDGILRGIDAIWLALELSDPLREMLRQEA